MQNFFIVKICWINPRTTGLRSLLSHLGFGSFHTVLIWNFLSMKMELTPDTWWITTGLKPPGPLTPEPKMLNYLLHLLSYFKTCWSSPKMTGVRSPLTSRIWLVSNLGFEEGVQSGDSPRNRLICTGTFFGARSTGAALEKLRMSSPNTKRFTRAEHRWS